MTDTDLDAFLNRKKPPTWRRIVKLATIGVGVLVALVLLSRCFRGPPPVQYAQQPVERGNLTVTISATGNLAPTKQVNVGSEESGLIDAVYVQNNDRVTKGQPLARLDLSRLRDALIQSQASLLAAQAAVEQGRATLDQTSSNLSREEQVFKISGGKVPSQTELSTARADRARAVANIAQARAQVAQARAQVSTNQTNLSKGTIYAPVTGVVLSRQVEPGQTVAASFNVTTLFTIAEDLSAMKLEVKVDEADVGELHTGAAASFTVDAYPGRVFPATVTRVDLGANATPSVNSAGTTSSTASSVVAYTAVLSVANPELLLKPGMTATADIVANQRRGVLLAPNAALRFDPALKPDRGGVVLGNGPPGMQQARPKQAAVGRGALQQVFTVGADGKPKPVLVTIGDTDGSRTEVSGVAVHAGLKVITGQLAKTVR